MIIFSVAFLVLLLPMVCEASETITKPNFNADCMSRGCTVKDVVEELGKLSRDLHKMISWNVKDENMENVCSILSQLDLTVRLFSLF